MTESDDPVLARIAEVEAMQRAQQQLAAPKPKLPSTPVSEWEYRVVPFFYGVAGSKSMAEAMLAMINANAIDGFEFYRMDPVVAPAGCLAGLFGARTWWALYAMATFRRRTTLASE